MRIEEPIPIDDSMLEEQLMVVEFFGRSYSGKEFHQLNDVEGRSPRYADHVNYLACRVEPPNLTSYERKNFSETYTITTGMSLIFTLSLKIRSTGDASQKMK